MKPRHESSNPNPVATLETFGGDYHRVESTFRPKKTPSRLLPRAAAKSREASKGKRKSA
jgi:hypothetical protein